jgi:hypothetical protein
MWVLLYFLPILHRALDDQKMIVVIEPLIAVIQDLANAIRALAVKGVITTVCTIIVGQSDTVAHAHRGRGLFTCQ